MSYSKFITAACLGVCKILFVQLISWIVSQNVLFKLLMSDIKIIILIFIMWECGLL